MPPPWLVSQYPGGSSKFQVLPMTFILCLWKQREHFPLPRYCHPKIISRFHENQEFILLLQNPSSETERAFYHLMSTFYVDRTPAFTKGSSLFLNYRGICSDLSHCIALLHIAHIRDENILDKGDSSMHNLLAKVYLYRNSAEQPHPPLWDTMPKMTEPGKKQTSDKQCSMPCFCQDTCPAPDKSSC